MDMAKKVQLTKEQVLHIAKLANLHLTPEEVEKLRNQLSQTLDYVEILNKVNTNKVELTSQVTGLKNVLREDKVTPSLSQEEALSGTKNTEKGYFKVKAIFE